jgi:hypothetical protein
MDDITPQQLIARMDAYLAQQDAYLAQHAVSQQEAIASLRQSNAELAEATRMLQELNRGMAARWHEDRAAHAAEMGAWAAMLQEWRERREWCEQWERGGL